MAHPLINIAMNAAHIAADMMRQEFPKVASIPVTQKARHDYVSEIDKSSEAQIVREIRRYHPDHAFLGEEGGAQGQGDYVWIIDPLDGTSNYLHGMPHYAISIALQVKGRTEHAVVYDVVRDEMFHASRGSGAHLNNTRIRVSPRNSLDSAIAATAFPFRQRGMMSVYTGSFLARCSRRSKTSAATASPRSTSRGLPRDGWTPISKSASSPGTSPPAHCWSGKPAG